MYGKQYLELFCVEKNIHTMVGERQRTSFETDHKLFIQQSTRLLKGFYLTRLFQFSQNSLSWTKEITRLSNWLGSWTRELCTLLNIGLDWKTCYSMTRRATWTLMTRYSTRCLNWKTTRKLRTRCPSTSWGSSIYRNKMYCAWISSREFILCSCFASM